LDILDFKYLELFERFTKYIEKRIVNKCVNNSERKRLFGFPKFKEVFLKNKDLEIVLSLEFFKPLHRLTFTGKSRIS